MNEITLQGTDLSVTVPGGAPLSMSIQSLRLVYLFLPKEFKHRFVVPSETRYRYVDLDSLAEEEARSLVAQLTQPHLGEARDQFLFVLKDYAQQTFTPTLKELLDADEDILNRMIATANERQAARESWLEQDPQVTVNHVTFDLHGVSKRNKAIPWRDLDRTGIEEKDSALGKSIYVHFIPRKGAGLKRFYQGVRPHDVESFLAEIDFWRSRSLAPEELEAINQRQAEAHERSTSQALRWAIIIAAILFGAICLVAVAALLFSG